jgi:hypothetical protein
MATTTCGDAFSEEVAFAGASGCSYPGFAPTASDAGSPPCSSAPPQSAFTPGGCFYSKSCNGHDYTIRCPSGYPCYCDKDGLWTADTVADCSNASSLGTAYGSDCGFP